ncbi:MAG TPA: peptidyl-prolyl cis-trans isomerase [Candidatus Sulfotelmatobacter sp.]|nr:peptidyl-prolyl cis-trans isomerase [Candidatus Sulfotelmatobacter sp.]
MMLAAGVPANAAKSTRTDKSSKSSKSKTSSGAKPAAPVPESLQVLVKIGKETITRGDAQRRLEELPEQVRGSYTTPEGRQQLLDRMIEEKVWMLKATQEGVPARPDVQRQLEQSRRDLIIRTYLNEVMSSNPAPTDSQARVYYDAHLSEYKLPATVTMRHIQSKTPADSKKMLGYARAKGADFAALAKKYSADTLTRANGGALGTVTREGMFGSLGAQPALAESAFALGEGKIGGPYKTNRGYHVIKVESIHLESTRPFDQVRSIIMRQLSSQSASDYYRTQLDKARNDVGITPDSTAIKSFLSTRRSARDLFKEAQEAGPPAERVAKYQALLEQYPDSDVSPQAQFMIGFIYSEELKKYDQAEQAFRQLLARYPKSELAPSAQWMVDHMRTEDAPSFLNLEADSTRGGASSGSKKGPTGKP